VLGPKTFQQQAGALSRALSTIAISPTRSTNPAVRPYAAAVFQHTTIGTLPENQHLHRFFATNIDLVKTPSVGTVTKSLRVLSRDVVRQILDDLESVDANSDGRIETDELKQLLRKHHSAFTEEEVFEIGEIFYAGKSGGSVPFDRFIEAVDRVVQKEKLGNGIDRDEDGNPLQIGTCGEFLFGLFCFPTALWECVTSSSHLMLDQSQTIQGMNFSSTTPMETTLQTT